MKWSTFFLPVVVVFSNLSCEDNERIIVPVRTGTNVPTYASVLNAFSYSITAEHLTRTQTIPLSFTKNRLQIAAAIPNGVQGSAIFALFDEGNALIHADTFRLPGMYQVLQFTGLPASVTTTFQDFSGSIQYTLAGDSAAAGYFPNGRGSQWTYFVYDSLAHISDTLTVTIFGHTILPMGIETTVWQYAYSTFIETLYVNTSQDTIRFYETRGSTWGNFNYVFPLFVGSRWRLGPSDSSAVVQVDSLRIPAGLFADAFLVRSDWSGFNDYRTVRSWFVPFVGIAKVHKTGFSFGMANTTWELLSYRVQ